MEICLSLTSPGASVPDLASLAAWGESAGFRTGWTAEVAVPSEDRETVVETLRSLAPAP